MIFSASVNGLYDGASTFLAYLNGLDNRAQCFSSYCEWIG